MKPQLKLSTKVFLIASLNFVMLAVVFLVFMLVQFRLDLRSFLMAPARDRLLSVARQFALELRETDSAAWNELLARYSSANKVEFTLVDERGTQLAGPNDGFPPELTERFTRQVGRRDRDFPLAFLGTTSNPTRHWVAVRIPVPNPGGAGRRHGALVAASSSVFGAPFFFDPKPWLAMGFAVVIISVLCWLPLARGLTHSISHMTRATAQIAEGNFEIQLPISRRDELGQLSASINRMASRLTGFVKGQKRFLGDTAHELCSPIARMQVALGILERSATPEQSACLEDLREDLQHMSTLVNDVLSFSKASLRPVSTELLKVNIADTVRRVLDREALNGTGVNTAVRDDLNVLADPDLLFRAISNVVRNAVRYAGHAGPIQIAAERSDGLVIIRVSDHGPGLEEKDLEAVFEPFYRPEPARARETGGVGLGLAIVKTCIESCEGSVKCRNRRPTGLEVELRLKSV
ncbi:MAG TPA: HAMP domain-containing sensor histidine kinase [Terriglobales bacterium]|nr:HAMP domain-containing sensor histidine kinase [Terriglobales bacterium]